MWKPWEDGLIRSKHCVNWTVSLLVVLNANSDHSADGSQFFRKVGST
jgi:hypothetical protein